MSLELIRKIIAVLEYDGPWIEKRIEWKCPDHKKHNVGLFGSWNLFKHGDELEYQGNQVFACNVKLPLGSHVYRFLVDAEHWETHNGASKTAINGIEYNQIHVAKDSNLSFSCLKKPPFYIDCQPIYYDGHIFFAEQGTHFLHIYSIKDDSYSQIAYEKHEPYSLNWYNMINPSHRPDVVQIYINRKKKEIFICSTNGIMRNLNLSNKKWTISKLSNKEWSRTGGLIGCYIEPYNLLYFMKNNINDNHFIYDPETSKLQSVYRLCFKPNISGSRYMYFPPNQIFYCSALHRLICIRYKCVYYITMNEIQENKYIKWKMYDYHELCPGEVVGVLWSQCYLLLFDEMYNIHCLHLKSGVGYKPKQNYHSLRPLMEDEGENILFAINIDDVTIHLFSQSMHVKINLVTNARIIDAYLSEIERICYKHFSSDLRGVIKKYHPNRVL